MLGILLMAMGALIQYRGKLEVYRGKHLNEELAGLIGALSIAIGIGFLLFLVWAFQELFFHH